MQDKLTIQGLPNSIAMDGWWLDALGAIGGPPGGDDADARGGIGRMPRALGLLLLVGLADLLFWSHAPGISAALFAWAIFAVATSDIRPRRALIRPAVLVVLGALSVVDHVQLLSLAFLAAALTCALIWARHPQAAIQVLVRAGLVFIGRLPMRWIAALDPRRLELRLGEVGRRPRGRQMIRDWAFPVGGTLVFAALLMDANPLLARLFSMDVNLWTAFERIVFWCGVALLVAPLIGSDVPLDTGRLRIMPVRLPGFGLNAPSVLRALAMFNLLIGLQMVTDMSILIGGAALPANMTYADYAHRGAYPLLATAILAGAFVLVARPFLGEHRLIRPLMLIWLGQNVVLCGAAALRLDLYIGAYGLTYLRLYAFIWIGLVAAGLAMTLWQVLRGRDNGWLVKQSALLGVGTLCLCSFFNFAHLIAAQNLTRERPDMAYVCELGPMAAGALAEATRTRPDHLIGTGVKQGCAAMHAPRIDGWQEWGFRKWKVRRYLAEVKERSALSEDPDR
jgi:Domain of unknown function (DUF4173)